MARLVSVPDDGYDLPTPVRDRLAEVVVNPAVAAEADVREAADTAQQAALATKAPLASPTFTGTPAAPTPTAGDSTTKIATTAFVATAVANGTSGADELWLPAPEFHEVLTSTGATRATLGKAWPSYRFADGAVQGVAAMCRIPAGWSTVDVDFLHVMPASSGSGDVVFRIDVNPDGADTYNADTSPPSQTTFTLTVGAQSIMHVEPVTTGLAVTAGNWCAVRVIRLGTAAADTCTSAYDTLGVLLTKAS